MTRPANTFGAVVSDGGAESPAVTDFAGELDLADGPPDDSTPADSSAAESGSASADSTAAVLRAHGERVRRRELDAALDRLAADGDVTPEERRLVARLSADIADALVEQWVAGLGLAGVDEDAALALFSE